MPALEEAQYRHAAHFLRKLGDLRDESGPASLDSARQGLPNIFLAMDWAMARPGQSAAANLVISALLSPPALSLLRVEVDDETRIRWLHAALTAARATHMAKVECAFLIALGDARRSVHPGQACSDCFAPALELARSLGDATSEVVALGGLALTCQGAGDTDAARRWLEEELARAESSGSNEIMAIALSHAAEIEMASENLAEAKALFDESIALDRDRSGGDAYQALQGRGIAAALLGDMGSASASIEEALGRALGSGQVDAEHNLVGRLALALHLRGDHHASSERFRQFWSLARKRGTWPTVALLIPAMEAAFLRAGLRDELRTLLDDIEVSARAAGQYRVAALALQHAADSHLQQVDPGQADEDFLVTRERGLALLGRARDAAIRAADHKLEGLILCMMIPLCAGPSGDDAVELLGSRVASILEDLPDDELLAARCFANAAVAIVWREKRDAEVVVELEHGRAAARRAGNDDLTSKCDALLQAAGPGAVWSNPRPPSKAPAGRWWKSLFAVAQGFLARLQAGWSRVGRDLETALALTRVALFSSARQRCPSNDVRETNMLASAVVDLALSETTSERDHLEFRKAHAAEIERVARSFADDAQWCRLITQAALAQSTDNGAARAAGVGPGAGRLERLERLGLLAGVEGPPTPEAMSAAALALLRSTSASRPG